MLYKLHRTDIKLNQGEELDLSIVLKPEKRSAIHGTVRFPNGEPAKNAIVKLFKKDNNDPCKLIPITFTYTDEYGQFLFGVDSSIDFIIKVFFYKLENEHSRRLEEYNIEDFD